MKNSNEPEGCPILECTFSILLFPVTDADFRNAIRRLNHPNLLTFMTFQALISKVGTISIFLCFYLSVSQDPLSFFAATFNIFKTTIVSYLVYIALVRFLIISLKCLNT